MVFSERKRVRTSKQSGHHAGVARWYFKRLLGWEVSTLFLVLRAGDGNPFCSDKKPGRYTQKATLARFLLTPFDSSPTENKKPKRMLEFLLS
jgi:hypothetical protein